MPHVRNQTGASGTHYHYKKYVKCRLYTSIIFKKSLKIPKWWTETVNLWRTANTMVKRKRTKWNNNDLQNITHKTKDRATRKLGWTQVPQKGLQMNSGSPKGSADELMFPRRVCRTQFPRRVCRTQVPQKSLQNSGSPEGFAVPAPHMTIHLFGFQTFRLWAYLMKVYSETRLAYFSLTHSTRLPNTKCDIYVSVKRHEHHMKWKSCCTPK